MVLVSPVISPDPTSPHKGSLIVNFPPESGCESFSVPLQPTEEYLKNWQILPNITLWTSDMDAYICQSEPPIARTPSEILSAYFGKSVYLLYKGPRPRPVDPTTDFPELQATAVFQDGYPLLVLSEESMGRVEEEIKSRVGTMGVREAWKDAKVPIERFRPNIVIKGGGPFAEDMWEEIAIGSETAPGITLVSKCARCLLPNVSPDTGERDPAVPYKILMKFRTGIDPADKMKPCVGCNAVPAASGVVSVGDVVIVRRQFV
ncbi:MOSC domain-containing protein [Infundibulicybe gibba]|nr:MOSC domain-containing protein [Infundibulicybe gibba]